MRFLRRVGQGIGTATSGEGNEDLIIATEMNRPAATKDTKPTSKAR